jgi:hypothetical protein
VSERLLPPATAFDMASRQREISVSEFFLKNRHLLGFDTPAKALVTLSKRQWTMLSMLARRRGYSRKSVCRSAIATVGSRGSS